MLVFSHFTSQFYQTIHPFILFHFRYTGKLEVGAMNSYAKRVFIEDEAKEVKLSEGVYHDEMVSS